MRGYVTRERERQCWAQIAPNFRDKSWCVENCTRSTGRCSLLHCGTAGIAALRHLSLSSLRMSYQTLGTIPSLLIVGQPKRLLRYRDSGWVLGRVGGGRQGMGTWNRSRVVSPRFARRGTAAGTTDGTRGDGGG